MCHSYRASKSDNENEGSCENSEMPKNVANAAEALCHRILRYTKCTECNHCSKSLISLSAEAIPHLFPLISRCFLYIVKPYTTCVIENSYGRTLCFIKSMHML